MPHCAPNKKVRVHNLKIDFADFHHSSPTLEFPTWMHQAPAGYADLTDLECMAAIPVRVASRGSPPVASSAAASGGLPVACSVEAGTEALVKAEAILANLQQRFKKDQIYVSIKVIHPKYYVKVRTF